MITCTRVLEFDAGHRIHGHESKCAHLHGHRYKVEITCRQNNAGDLDGLGRVIDFGKIKELVGRWIDTNLDHNLILFDQDPLVQLGDHLTELHGRPPFLLPYNPTAENLAQFIRINAATLLAPYWIQVIHVRVYETPNCWADNSETEFFERTDADEVEPNN